VIGLLLCGGFPASCGGCGGNNTIDSDGFADGADAPPTCIDRDGDGYGTNCELGGDCDDNDPDHWSDCSNCNLTHAEGCACEEGESYFCYDGPSGTDGVGQCKRGLRSCIDGRLGPCDGQVLPDTMETCEDGIDNNCNGQVDEDWFCGDCTPPCHTDGPVEPSPSDPGSSGLIPNPDGPGVILGTSDDESGFAWIANTGEGTVSKLDIVTGDEIGRYRVGLWGTADDKPSRTAVDDYQSAYVANRAFDRQGSVSKIAGFERYCIDRNGNGEIDTAHGSSALPLGEDECVLWTAEVGDSNGVPRALVIDFGNIDIIGGFPWVGCFHEQRFYKLDPADGSVLSTVDLDVNTYGAAIDSEGWIWVSGRGSNAIQRFHYLSETVEPSISIPSSVCHGENPYGITVDLNDRIWVGVWNEGGACRYDPSDGSWFFVDTGGRARGIAVDADNIIWASNDSNEQLYRFSADDGSGLQFFGGLGDKPIGVGVDPLGKIWTVNHDSNDTSRFDPSASAFDGTFSVGSNPYTYSDFLGFQRWLRMPNGIWIRSFERCDERPGDKWLDLTWDTETPAGSHIAIVGRSADTTGEILSAPEVIIAEIGPDPEVGSRDLETVFSAAGVELGRFLEITVILTPGGIDDPVSPILKSVQVYYSCTSLG